MAGLSPRVGGGNLSDRELRQYLHPITAILLPAGQAAVSAIAGGVTVASVAWYIGADNPIAAGGVAAGVTFGLSWVIALAWWRDRITQTGGPTPQPVTEVVYPAESIRVELSQDNGRVVDFLDWQGDRDILILAAADLRTRHYETSNLGGAGKTLSRSQAESVRDFLISSGLAAWVRPEAHTAGWGILPEGRAVIRRLHHLGISSGIVDPPPPKAITITEAKILERMQTHTETQTAVFPAGLVAAGDQADQDTIDELWRV